MSRTKETAIDALAETQILTTERLVLRPFGQGDLDDYAALYADREVVRYLAGGPEPWDRSRSWRHLAFVRGHWQLKGTGMWAIEHRESGAFVGSVGFWEPEGWPGFELAWALARHFWGFGLATEAARAALDHAFAVWRKDRVISLIHPENRASVRVAERLGESLLDRIHHGGREMLLFGIEAPANEATPILSFPRCQPTPSPGEGTLQRGDGWLAPAFCLAPHRLAPVP
ncbi:MAG TPA: GNAT family N-acetyltransferase [Thermoanaerobaculia bacterium]|nr:GNAT family N-acetyltransferase [Thermoanaerobaculia bacterium]